MKRGYMMKTIQERIEAHTYPDPNTGCLLHDFSCKNNYGHAQIWYEGKLRNLYRIIYSLHYGEIPEGLQVNHRCDNAFCCNPEHLYLGTQLDNMQDRVKAGRYKGLNAGESNPQHKLTDAQVNDIRNNVGSNKNIATIYSISPSMVSMIKSYKRRAYGVGSMRTDGKS
jgi:hypothetical protein